MQRVIISCLLVTVLVMGLVVAGGTKQALAQTPPKAGTAELEKLYEAAKKEGEVIIWAGTSADSMVDLAKIFNQRFPGIKVTFSELTGTQATERIVVEASAGKCNVDIAQTTQTTVLPVIEKGLAANLDWVKLAGIPKEWVVFDQRGAFWYSSARVVGYRTDLVAPKDVPKSYEDLMDPKWKGRILMEMGAVLFAALPIVLPEERVTKLLKGCMANKPILVKGNTAIATRPVAGEGAVCVVTFLSKILEAQRKGAPVDWARISPITTDPRVVYVTRDAPHPNAARLFAGWILTSEARKKLEELTFEGLILPGSDSVQSREIEKSGVQIMYPRTKEDILKKEKYEEMYSKMLMGK